MDLNKCISRSFDNRRTSHDRSTVFDATFEQAQLSDRKSCPKQLPLDLNRNPISQRSSNTFHSEVFKPPARQLRRFRLNQPQDHSYRDFYGNSESDFYRKAEVSDFQPNFQPKFSYQPGWEVSHPGFESTKKQPASQIIKPVKKRLSRSDSRREALETRFDQYELDGRSTRIHDSGCRRVQGLGTERLERDERCEGNERRLRTQREERTEGTQRPERQRVERSQDLRYAEVSRSANSKVFEKLNKTQLFEEKRKPLKKVHFEAASPNSLSQTVRTPLKTEEEARVRPIYKESSHRPHRSSTPKGLNSQELSTNPKLFPSNPLPPSSVRSQSPSTNICLSISGLTSKESEFSLREACKGFQIVSLSSSRNNISGLESGTARITLKATESSLADLKSSFEQKGLTVGLSLVSNGKKNNYAELAHVDFLNQFVNKDSSRTPIKHYLESSEDLFGSSPGVGRFHSGKKIRDKQALALQSWNFVKQSRDKEKGEGQLNSLPSYMRSTQSSARKCKKVN